MSSSCQLLGDRFFADLRIAGLVEPPLDNGRVDEQRHGSRSARTSSAAGWLDHGAPTTPVRRDQRDRGGIRFHRAGGVATLTEIEHGGWERLGAEGQD